MDTTKPLPQETLQSTQSTQSIQAMQSMQSMQSMHARISEVQARIRDAARRAGRHPEDVLLLAVSKTVEPEVMKAAYACGLRAFGENRVQEYLRKKAALEQLSVPLLPLETPCAQIPPNTMGDALDWHFIGRVQTNKVRLLANQPLLVHSLDRMELLEALCRQAERSGCQWKVLIEVNVSGEATKAGVAVKDLEQLVRAASRSGCISVCGLMTVAPDTPDPALARPVFRGLRELAVDIRSWKLDNVVMNHLSMGMSHDLDVAVEEGSTIVRVGTALFGERSAQPDNRHQRA